MIITLMTWVNIIVYFILCAFILILCTRTPALKFLRASMGGKSIIINPLENKYLTFLESERKGSMLYVKKHGFYMANSADVYIEEKSKVPCIVAYGNFGPSLNLKMVKLTEKLGELGIKNYIDLISNYEAVRKEKGSAKKYVFKLHGESIPFDDVVNYFGRNERADYIEAEIQRRTANQLMDKLKEGLPILKWVIPVGVLIILVAIAYQIFMSGQASSLMNTVNSVSGAAKTMLPSSVS